jgi:uncharacterized SAM-dependent methyltransferase
MVETLGRRRDAVDRDGPGEGAGTLIAAYDDAAGVTAAFNLNLLHRINRELDADVPIDAFRHRAIWNDYHARIEMHLEAVRDVAFTIVGEHFALQARRDDPHREQPQIWAARRAHAAPGGRWEPVAEWTDPRISSR